MRCVQEVLGVSLDREYAEGQTKAVAARHGTTWDQIYDKAIPATYLVDGNTGKIPATGADLRGVKLVGTLEKVFAGRTRRRADP
ncbi:MAG TPA: hypothetical protein VGE01_07595 [Fimbriimonas sp.]